MCYVALLMLMQPHEIVMVSSLMFAAGGHLCQTASTLIPGVASMPDQGENKKSACIAFLLSVNNANLGHHAKAVLRG